MFANKDWPDAETAAEDDTNASTSALPGSGDDDNTKDPQVISPETAVETEPQPEQDEEASAIEAAAPEVTEATAEVQETETETAIDEAEAEAVIDEAEAEDETVIDEAEAEAETIIDEAEAEAETVIDEAEAEDETVIDEAEAEAETAIDGAEAETVIDEAEAEDEQSQPQDDRAWYVVHCYSGYENKVKHNLEQRIETMQMQDQIFQVVVPTEDEMEVRDGKRRVVERRVFPGYILVQMALNEDSWYAVRNTPGVTGFVGMGNEPTPLRPEEVQAIMKRMEAEAPKIKVTFKSGQKVRIIDGPFNEFIGMVDEIDMERAKVRVLVSFFGRETPIELDFLQVEKA